MCKPVLERAQEYLAHDDERNKPARRASIGRHVRKCSVCNHPDRESIDHDYLRWRSPERIAKDYRISHHSAVYRHAEATGLIARRQGHLRATLENFIECADSVRVTAGSVVSAIRMYSQINDKGQWVPAPKPTSSQGSLFAWMPLKQILIANSCKPKMAHLVENKRRRPALIANFEPTACARKSAPVRQAQGRQKVVGRRPARRNSGRSIFLPRVFLSCNGFFLGIIGTAMAQQLEPKSSVTKQLVISGWAVAVAVWYFHQFSPAFRPIIRGFLQKIWR